MEITTRKEVWRSLKADGLIQSFEETLKILEARIHFLESIYRTSGINYGFSKEFENAAIREREELCAATSALHSIIREETSTGV